MTLIFLTGCSHLGRISDYRNSTLSNSNPAPEKFSPPQSAVNGSSIDPFYMQTKADYHFTLGESYALEGNSEKAIEEYKQTLVYDANSPTVRLKLSTEYLKMGLITEAVEQAELVVKQNPKHIEARMLLAGLYASMRLYDLSISQYQMVMDIEPNNEEAALFIGAVLAEQKKYKEAENYFAELAKKGSKESRHKYLYYLGRIYLEQGKKEYAQAEKAFSKSLSLQPKYLDSVLALAGLYKEKSEVKKTIQLLSSYQDRFGPSRKVATALIRLYIETDQYQKAYEQLEVLENFDRQNLNVKSQMASILIELEKYKEAAAILEEILIIAPEMDKIRFRLGAVYEELKSYDLAIKNLMKIPSTSTYFPEAMIHSAHMSKLTGDMDKANDIMDEAIRLRSDIPQFYAFYSSLLDEQKKYVKAKDLLESAVKKHGKNAQLRFFLGSIYDRLGHQKETIEQMKEDLAIDENHIQAMNYLAYIYAETDSNLEEAEALALKALKTNPEDGYILDTVGWVYYKQGKIQIAIQYLEAAHKLKQDESIIAEHLGDAYYKYELNSKAKQMYLMAVQFEEDKEKVAKIKAKIVAIDRQKTIRNPASLGSSQKMQNPSR